MTVPEINYTDKIVVVFSMGGQTGPNKYENWVETVILSEYDTIRDLITAMEKRKCIECQVTIPKEKERLH